MDLPLQVSFHNMTATPAMENVIRECAAKLERFYDRLTGCRVVVDVPHRHHQNGNPYQIRIDLTLPGGEIVVNREPPGQPGNTTSRDFGQAVRDAFDAARRQLEDYARRQRGDVKYNG
jgi:ribosome-associated translation inhibitor RaiA